MTHFPKDWKHLERKDYSFLFTTLYLSQAECMVHSEYSTNNCWMNDYKLYRPTNTRLLLPRDNGKCHTMKVRYSEYNPYLFTNHEWPWQVITFSGSQVLRLQSGRIRLNQWFMNCADSEDIFENGWTGESVQWPGLVPLISKSRTKLIYFKY